jgi:Reverse transcriptase (RNA-dependent DNA polymerase)
MTILLRKPRKSDYSDPSAYRLITLLNTLRKVLEAIIARRMRYAVKAHKLLPETQIKARRGRSTETALHLLTEKIYTIWARNKPRITSILSLNVAGAFDRVSHARLAHNLRKRKISETLVRWVKDFLKDRYTEIRIADFTLKKSRVDVDIPQGSPVSPILYLFYNADLLKIYENLTLRTSPIGFVNDVNLLTYNTSAEENCRNLERIYDVCEN